ncbi:werner syndrome-like exonuclease-like protein, partial [Trifolium pratense]
MYDDLGSLGSPELVRNLPGNRLRVGLGLQWDVPRYAATLQLCVGTKVLLYQLERAKEITPALRDFLANPAVEFVGFLDPEVVVDKLRHSRHSLQLTARYRNLRKYLPFKLSRMTLTQIVESEDVLEDTLGAI